MNEPNNVNTDKSKAARRVRGVWKVILWGVAVCFAVTLITAAVLCIRFGPAVIKWYGESRQIAENSSKEDFRISETSYLFAADGSQLLKLKQDRDVVYVEYENLPEHVLEGFIAIEDKRYYKHKGVDVFSTIKALYLLFTNKGEVVRGGSTITQQLARNVYLSFETSYERKMREIFLAIDLEKKYSKKQILEFYINNINYAGGYYGIGAAAKGYFDKDVSELAVEEIAFLCAIPNNPSYYNPRVNFEHTVKRRNLILEEMYAQGFLTEDEWLTARDSSVTLIENEETYYDYAASYALDCAVRIFMDKSGFKFRYEFNDMGDYQDYRENYQNEYAQAKDLLSSGGYSVYTSIDLDAQHELQTVVDETLLGFESVDGQGNYVVQGAATVIDNRSGAVIAIVGGRSQEDSGYLSLNRAFQSYRQPGSTIKPLIVYAPALERGYTATSLVKDTPIKDGPKNSDNRYSGTITLRTAVEKSKNVVAWRLLEELSPKTGLSYLQNMRFNRVVPDDYYVSAALGGFTYGVSTVEMAGGYSALYNDGVWNDASCIMKIFDRNGIEITDEREQLQVFDEEAAHVMTDILTGVAKRGTATGIKLEGGHEFACKTGTTNDNKEGWFCGYTSYYSVAVYVGADSSQPVEGLWGSTYPASIWSGIQNKLLEGKSPIPLLPLSEQVERPTGQTLVEPVEEGIEEEAEVPEIEETEIDEPEVQEEEEAMETEETEGSGEEGTEESEEEETEIQEEPVNQEEEELTPEEENDQEAEEIEEEDGSTADGEMEPAGSFADEKPEEPAEEPSESTVEEPEPLIITDE